MMKLKLSVFITLALFALAVLSMRDPPLAQVDNVDTARPAGDAPVASSPPAKQAKPTLQECKKRCKKYAGSIHCIAGCLIGH